ncbi:DUF6188 family protein [Streptomyces sp. NPDC048352]|uniref:DUF6188 family protein n=1 Tax=Streptomyces sp. NPDC048352 TaxID=3154718 RepID=UPI0034278A78
MIQELDDRWILGLRGSRVVAVGRAQDGPELVVTLADGTGLAVSGPVLLTDGPCSAPGAVALAVEESDRLVGATVLSAVAFRSGLLRFVFSTGHHLNVRGAEPGVTARVRQPEVFSWRCRRGVATMEVPGPEGAGH